MSLYDDLFDDPEDAPEDDNDPDELYPGDPPVDGRLDDFDIVPVVYDSQRPRDRDPDLRRRRLERIADLQSTQEYRNVRREELRSRYGGSHVT